MAAATYEQLVCMDPTNSFLYKGAMLLDRIVTRLRHRILIQLTRLLLLGFYEDFRKFVRGVEQAEDLANSENEVKAICRCKFNVAEKVEMLLTELESLEGLTYDGADLLDYLLGKDRLHDLTVFVRAAKIDREAEKLLDRAKGEFLKSFAKRKLTKTQRTAILQKYDELLQLVPEISERTAPIE